jgi:phosphoserine phosphatase
VKNRLDFDYAFANNLLFHDSLCTGEVILHNSALEKDEVTNKIYSISKSTILQRLCNKHRLSLQESIAVGDGIVDCGMLTVAGLGVAVFTYPDVQKCADISTNNIMDILTYIGG